jgi:hypothetical protein
MDDKDIKRGFSGLSDLSSDTRTIPQAQPRQTRVKSYEGLGMKSMCETEGVDAHGR